MNSSRVFASEQLTICLCEHWTVCTHLEMKVRTAMKKVYLRRGRQVQAALVSLLSQIIRANIFQEIAAGSSSPFLQDFNFFGVDPVVELAYFASIGKGCFELGDANAILALQMTVGDVVDEFLLALGELIVVLVLRELTVLLEHVEGLVESRDEMGVVHWLDIVD